MRRSQQWDKQFTEQQLIAQRAWHLRDFLASTAKVRWEWPIESWSYPQVEFAIYNAPDALNWQLFRVSMKRLDTYEKLAMLYSYYQGEFEGQPLEKQAIEKCRIDNYILALRRGGLLNQNYEVIA